MCTCVHCSHTVVSDRIPQGPEVVRQGDPRHFTWMHSRFLGSRTAGRIRFPQLGQPADTELVYGAQLAGFNYHLAVRCTGQR